MPNLASKEKGFKISFLNIHHLYGKLDQLKAMLHESNQLHVLGLCETFLDNTYSDTDLQIEGYNLIRRDRPNRIGGGIAIYISEYVSFKVREDLDNSNIESLWVELKLPKSKPILLSTVYRPPDSGRYWVSEFEKQLEQAYAEDKEVILIGDFNKNLLVNNQEASKWLETFNTYGLSQLVREPTRVTKTTNTLLDHFYTTNPEHIKTIMVPKIGLSDHFPICITRKHKAICTQTYTHKCIQYRSQKEYDPDNFIKDLVLVPWSVLDSFEDPNDALNMWTDMYLEVLDRHAPMRQRRVKHTKQPEWLNNEIIEAIKLRDTFKAQNDDKNYKYFRNKVVHMIHSAKKEFYTNKVKNNKGNIKEIWNCIKDLSPNENKTQITSITHENNSYVKPKDIADILNKKFVGVSQLLNPVRNHKHVFKGEKLQEFVNAKFNDPDKRFVIPEIKSTFIFEYLSKLNITKSSGPDGIQNKYIKVAASVLAPNLAYIINLSIKTGIFPDAWKQARVSPIHKSGPKDDGDNYRPISILSTLSKIIERHIHDHLYNYLCEYNLLLLTQSGFRNNHSCQTALTRLIDTWLKAIDTGEMTGVILLDFRKAFDLVDHKILLQKLRIYRIGELALKWFESYLQERKQKVFVNNVLSDNETITSGVPQGSILGPLLFILFVNDINLYSENCNMDLYADDTTIHTHGKCLNSIAEKLQKDLENLERWSLENNMIIHPEKSKSMVIASWQKRNTLVNKTLAVRIDNVNIKQSDKEKLLGVFINQNLTWNDHAQNVNKKIASRLYLLRRLKAYLPINARIIFYNSFILPHLDYCDTIWGNCNQSNEHKMVRLQKCAARLILDDTSSSSSELLNKLKWQSFPERVKFHKACLVYKSLNDLAPEYLKEIFSSNRSSTNYNLRNNTNMLHVPKANTELFKKSLTFSGAKTWNMLSDNVRTATSLTDFKRKYMKEFWNK